MKRYLILFTLLIAYVSLFTGCWSKREIDELAIASAVGIDKTKEGYLVTAQIINPGEIAAEKTSNRTVVSSYRASGETVFEAIRRLTLETPRKTYFGHIRLLVLGEDLAREGIGKTLDFFSRDPEIRTDFYIIIAKNSRAEELLNILTPIEKIPANKMYDSLEMSAKSWASTLHVTLDELIRSLLSKGKNPVLTGVIIKGSPQLGVAMENIEKVDIPTTIQIRYLGAFKKDKLVGWLNEEESIGYNYISDKVESTIVVITCSEEGKLGVEIIRTKAKIKGIVRQSKPEVSIDIWVEGNVADVECTMDVTNLQNIYEIETKVAARIKQETIAAIRKAQKELRSDIFGFGEAIHRADPKAWHTFKDDWDEIFTSLPIHVNVTSRIKRTGTITKSFQQELKE
ncbi:Ger(x)C family spore germination protein [Clostridiaceae bacterium 35-E11]